MSFPGILMTTAWMSMISISLIIARHYKSAWPELKVSGKDLWFPVSGILLFVHLGSNNSNL